MSKILFTAAYTPAMAPIGGVQSWILTLRKEFQLLGHEVVIKGPKDPLEDSVDFGIFSNLRLTNNHLIGVTAGVVMAHGVIKEENPHPEQHPFQVLCTSEEVNNHWTKDAKIIRQPIDLDFWSPGDVYRDTLVRFGYRKGSGIDFLQQIAMTHGLRYVRLKTSSYGKVRTELRRAAVTFATGRAALESMACGAPTVICDHRAAYQAPLMHPSISKSMAFNYSGRGGVAPTIANVTEAMLSAIAYGSRRMHVECYHNSKEIAEQLLCYM